MDISKLEYARLELMKRQELCLEEYPEIKDYADVLEIAIDCINSQIFLDRMIEDVKERFNADDTVTAELMVDLFEELRIGKE